MSTRIKASHKPIMHFAVEEETETVINLFADREKRSISAMIRILVEEALEARQARMAARRTQALQEDV